MNLRNPSLLLVVTLNTFCFGFGYYRGYVDRKRFDESSRKKFEEMLKERYEISVQQRKEEIIRLQAKLIAFEFPNDEEYT